MLYQVKFKPFLVLWYQCTVLVISFHGPANRVCTDTGAYAFCRHRSLCRTMQWKWPVLSTKYLVRSTVLAAHWRPRRCGQQPSAHNIFSAWSLSDFDIQHCKAIDATLQIVNSFYGNNRIKGKMQLSELLSPLRLGNRRSLHWWWCWKWSRWMSWCSCP